VRRVLGFVSLASCVDCGVSNVTEEEEEEEEEEACLSCAAKISVVLYFVCFFEVLLFMRGRERIWRRTRINDRELKPFLLCLVYAEICTYDLDIHVN